MLISPNKLHENAKKVMLDGCTPRTSADWAMCVNYWACNIAEGLEEESCLLLGLLFDCPLSEKDIRTIAKFQSNKKGKE